MAIIETYKGPSLGLDINTKRKFVLFDFDGVVVDSFAPAFEVTKMICPNTTEDNYRKRFEGNINDWQKTDLQHDKDCRHDVDFFAEYLPRMRTQVMLVAGMGDVIMELAKSYTLIIISSTISVQIQELLEKYSLESFFTEVMGNDVHKSKVEKMNMVFKKYNTTKKECIFITDTLGDMREALHTEVAAIGVTWGFHSLETLSEGKAYKIVEHPAELIPAVDEYFKSLV